MGYQAVINLCCHNLGVNDVSTVAHGLDRARNMDSSNLAARVATLLQSGETGNMQAAKSAIRQHNLVSGLPDESSSQGAILDVIMDLINTDKVESEHEKAWKNCQTPSCITSVYKRITPQPLRRQSAFRNALPCLFRGQTQSAALC